MVSKESKGTIERRDVEVVGLIKMNNENLQREVNKDVQIVTQCMGCEQILSECVAVLRYNGILVVQHMCGVCVADETFNNLFDVVGVFWKSNKPLD